MGQKKTSIINNDLSIHYEIKSKIDGHDSYETKRINMVDYIVKLSVSMYFMLVTKRIQLKGLASSY